MSWKATLTLFIKKTILECPNRTAKNIRLTGGLMKFRVFKHLSGRPNSEDKEVTCEVEESRLVELLLQNYTGDHPHSLLGLVLPQIAPEEFPHSGMNLNTDLQFDVFCKDGCVIIRVDPGDGWNTYFFRGDKKMDIPQGYDLDRKGTITFSYDGRRQQIFDGDPLWPHVLDKPVLCGAIILDIQAALVRGNQENPLTGILGSDRSEVRTLAFQLKAFLEHLKTTLTKSLVE